MRKTPFIINEYCYEYKCPVCEHAGVYNKSKILGDSILIYNCLSCNCKIEMSLCSGEAYLMSCAKIIDNYDIRYCIWHNETTLYIMHKSYNALIRSRFVFRTDGLANNLLKCNDKEEIENLLILL